MDAKFQLKQTRELSRSKAEIDFVLILWEADRPKLRIVECKASRRAPS